MKKKDIKYIYKMEKMKHTIKRAVKMDQIGTILQLTLFSWFNLFK